MSRTARRAKFDHDTRMSLAEDDLDGVDKQFEKVSVQLEGMRKLLVGILISVTTASVMLVINVLAVQ